MEQWEAIVPWLPKRLESGERVSFKVVMRRKIKGYWIYRRPTPEEESEYVKADAW